MPIVRRGFLALLLLAAAAPAAEFHVAPVGKDTNPGTKAQPFAGPAAAQAAVRKLIAAGLAEDVTVVLHAGTYYLPEGLAFTAADSGTEKHRVTYAGAPGEDAPVLVGGQQITGFKPHKGDIVVADLPRGAKPLVACENGVAYRLACSPNEGWGRAGGAAGAVIHAATGVTDGASAADGIVSLWPDYAWVNRHARVTAVTPDAITTAGVPGKIGPDKRFRLLNVLGALDSPGECVLAASEGKIYVQPRKAPIDRQAVWAATADFVIALRGDEKAPVRNLHFTGLDITSANKDAVFVTGASDCGFRACRIADAWERGVHVFGAAQRIEIADSEICNTGFNGVEFKGAPFGGPDINNNNRVENCHVHHCGVYAGHAAGIRMEDSGHNKILHNHIHHMLRSGTSVKSLTVQFMKNNDQKANRYKYLHSRNNLLAYNHIHDVDLDSTDTGAMQSWGPGRDNVYDHNLIHDVGNPGQVLQSGIYLDDSTDYFTVTNNIVYNVNGGQRTQCLYAKGIGNKIENNVLVVGPRCDAAVRTKASGPAGAHEYAHNIFFFQHPASIFHFEDKAANRIASCDNNLYFGAGGVRIGGASPYGRSFDQWKGRFDKNTLTVDPLFVDPAKHDYRLKADSPALKIGIRSIDTSKIGLTEAYPARLARE